MKKLRWWWLSVQGLRAHIGTFRAMDRAAKGYGAVYA